MTTPKLIILAGIPGCGKSTWARCFFDAHRIVSTDAIREELWPGQEYNHANNVKTFEVFYERILDKLPYGTLVADATSLRADSRIGLVTRAKGCCAEAHLVFFTNVTQALERNAQREGNALVPPEAMVIMCAKFAESLPLIEHEGYDSITYVESVS